MCGVRPPARPLIGGLRNPTVAHDNRLRSLVPFERTSFDTDAKAAIAAAQPDDLQQAAAVLVRCPISV